VPIGEKTRHGETVRQRDSTKSSRLSTRVLALKRMSKSL
jgi:hypothetical protein